MAAPLWLVPFALSLSAAGVGPVSSATLSGATLSGATTTLSSIDRETLKRTIDERSASFRACYEEALDRDPKARGRVAVKFTVEESGRVSDAVKTAGTTVKDEAMVTCVLDVFKSIEFTDWAKQKATITYPLDFEPAPKEAPPKDSESGDAP